MDFTIENFNCIFILFNMSFKCPFCPRTFSQRTAYSQHVQVCLRKVEVEEEESNSETHSIDITQDINESDDNELMEYEPFQGAAQDTSFSSMESTYSNLLSEISIMSYEENIELEESEVLEESEESEESEIFEEVKEPEPKALTEFPNDTYKDLMVLVTKHKLNNKAGNAIIQFFNKHSALSKSPLPKNIEKGRTFMNKMKFPNLSFNKICITYHNDREYFLHYQSLIQCIKNILAVPDITQNFALSFETMSVKEKVFIKNKITECGGRIPKGLCQQAPNYYHLFYIRMQQLQIHWVKANYIRYIYQLVIFQRGVATNLMPNNF